MALPFAPRELAFLLKVMDVLLQDGSHVVFQRCPIQGRNGLQLGDQFPRHVSEVEDSCLAFVGIHGRLGYSTEMG
jgi:hypothetical protein